MYVFTLTSTLGSEQWKSREQSHTSDCKWIMKPQRLVANTNTRNEQKQCNNLQLEK